MTNYKIAVKYINKPMVNGILLYLVTDKGRKHKGTSFVWLGYHVELRNTLTTSGKNTRGKVIVDEIMKFKKDFSFALEELCREGKHIHVAQIVFLTEVFIKQSIRNLMIEEKIYLN